MNFDSNLKRKSDSVKRGGTILFSTRSGKFENKKPRHSSPGFVIRFCISYFTTKLFCEVPSVLVNRMKYIPFANVSAGMVIAFRSD